MSGDAHISSNCFLGPRPYAGPPSPLDPPAIGPVYQIVTPRMRGESTAGVAAELHKHFPRMHGSPELAEAMYDRLFQSIERFNRDVIEMAGGQSIIAEEISARCPDRVLP